MSLDPNIILQVGRGVTPLENPFDMQAKMLNLQQGQLQLAQMRQQQADAQSLRQDIASANGDPAALKAALLKRGKVKEVHEMTTAEKQAQEAEAKRAKAHLDSVTGLNQQQLQVYQSALDALDKDPAQAQAIHSYVLGKTLENAKTLFPQMDTSKTDDPPGFQSVDQQKAWLQSKISGAMTFDQRLKLADQALRERELGNFGGFHPAVGPDGKPGIFQANKAGEVRQVPGLKPVPPSRGVTGVQLGAVTGTLNDPGEERIAQMVADGRLAAPPMSRNNPRNLRIIARADQISQERGSGLDAATFPTRAAALKFFTTGRGADAFRQQETILHHAKVFEQIAEALDNGNVQLANKLGTQFGAQFGSDKPTNYKMAGQIFSAEVGKYLAGSQSTQAERAELAELIPVFSSPEQFRGGLKTLSNLVEGQRKSWQRQKEAALKGLPTDTKDDAHGEAGPKRIKNDAEYNALPSGTVFIAPDGKTRRKP